MAAPRVVLSRIKKKLLKAGFRVLDAVTDGDSYVRFVYRQNGYHTPEYRFDSDQIMFVHLPKTAGTSFAKMLRMDAQQRFVSLDIHKPISAHCDPAAFRYITVMREPVARVWSYYQMVLRNPPGYPYRNYAVKGLEHFLKKSWPARNMACRYLTGNVDAEPTSATLKQAQTNLKGFYHVLDFDAFGAQASAFCAAHEIAVEQIPNERKANYTGPSEADAALIRQFNQLDSALYEGWKQSQPD